MVFHKGAGWAPICRTRGKLHSETHTNVPALAYIHTYTHAYTSLDIHAHVHMCACTIKYSHANVGIGIHLGMTKKCKTHAYLHTHIHSMSRFRTGEPVPQTSGTPYYNNHFSFHRWCQEPQSFRPTLPTCFSLLQGKDIKWLIRKRVLLSLRALGKWKPMTLGEQYFCCGVRERWIGQVPIIIFPALK